MSAATIEELKDVYTCHFCELMDYGVTKPCTSITFEDKHTIVQSITLHHILLKSKAEADQFSEGLSCLGTRDYIMKYPHLLQQFFTRDGVERHTAGKIQYSRQYCSLDHRPLTCTKGSGTLRLNSWACMLTQHVL